MRKYTMIKFHKHGHIARLTFDNDKKRNSLNTKMLEEITHVLDHISDDTRVLIIRSNPGAKVWSAGFNIDELPLPGQDPLPYDHPLENVLRKVQQVKCPVIAEIEGTVWGGAVDLALRCDIVVATSNTSFAITPAKIGVPYNTSGILRVLNAVNPNIAKEMFFTARPVHAERALQLGIINHLTAPELLHDFVQEMAENIAGNSPLSIRVIKEQINIITNAYAISINASEKIDQIRRVAYNSKDYIEGKKAFEERRKPNYKGE